MNKDSSLDQAVAADAPLAISLVRRNGQPAALPGLEPVIERFNLGLRHQIAAIANLPPVIRPDALRQLRFEDWQAGVAADRIALHCSLANGKLTAYLIVPVPLVIGLVDLFYGGDGAACTPRPQLTAAEYRLAERLADECCRVLAAAWRPIAELRAENAMVEADISRLAMCRADDPVIVQPLELSCDALGRHDLELVFGMTQLSAWPVLARDPNEAPAPRIDRAARDRMLAALMQVRLPVKTVFTRPEMPLSQLMTLQVGDIIPITLPQFIPVTVAKRVFAHGTLGDANGHAAIRITRIEPIAPQSLPEGLFRHE